MEGRDAMQGPGSKFGDILRTGFAIPLANYARYQRCGVTSNAGFKQETPGG